MAMTLVIGKGKYLIQEKIGRGISDVTYKAVNQTLNQIVVIKTFKSDIPQKTNLSEVRIKFLKEAKRLLECSHPNIIPYRDFFVEDGVPYIVMDYIPGQTLDKIVLPDNPLPEANALEYIQQVGKALKIVHQKGLLHRDIKPHNLIFREDNQQVVLINFGIAREFCSGAIQTHTNLATDGYAPIEQYLVKAKRTPATDVYALAATLYTLLTAKIPIAATVRNHTPLPSPKRIRPELSPQISNAVMYGMALEQEERPSSVDEWLALLSPEQGNNISVAKVNSKPIRQKQLTSFSSNSRILNPVNNQDFDELGAETYRQGEAEIALGENKNALKNELNTKEKKSVKIIVSDESAKQLNSNNRLWNILIIIGLILLGLDYAWLKYMHYLEEIQTQPNIINNR